ncbi:hypothetical protein F4553_002291 [Allocatelliglobosispora scoriae]|uniref:Uncharacterized protein n=1 Tax=Allocatelliglobosispora scoriae TaxID=643052 RepID=A0A841BQ77_9ACTN|nr:hypothetical protein [Allocatelliglobosispora scoriae]MBB5868912.1 hypothetical protein [Allocatelliglobosispora scoriae]
MRFWLSTVRDGGQKLFNATRYQVPTTNVGINLHSLYRLANHDFTLLTDKEFLETRCTSPIWALETAGSEVVEIESVDLVKDLRQRVKELKAAKTSVRTRASWTKKKHQYETAVFLGLLDEEMLSHFTDPDDFTHAIELGSCFAGRASGKISDEYADAPLLHYTGLDLQDVMLHPSLMGVPFDDVDTYRSKLVLKEKNPGRLALGTSIISRSLFRSGIQDGVFFQQYLASTVGPEHNLDGYALHTLYVDLATGELFFFAEGIGKHVIGMVDGINNPLAPFVFSVMGRTYYAYLKLNSERRKGKQVPIDIVRGGPDQRRVLEDYIRESFPTIAQHRQLTSTLDSLGRPLQAIKHLLGTNVWQSPPEEPASSGTTGPKLLTDEATDISGKVAVKGKKTGGGSGGSGRGSGGSFGAWPFLLPVLLLAYWYAGSDTENEELDENGDFNQIFTTLDADLKPMPRTTLTITEEE